MKVVYKQTGLFFIAFLCLNTIAMAQSSISKIDLSIYPNPEKGYKQMVIEVPYSDNDAAKKIEFTVGKWMEVDPCNKHGLQGSLEQKDLEGWGYSYYVFKSDGNVMSTQMACPDNNKVNQFITSQPEMVRYNGKLPVVIYVPEGYDVQFKIYKAEADVYQASEVKHK
ncbi:ecotin [Sinomicrobium weinanense]|uniref:Ecotin family protein n=1 Tax=Sinomicrobium weinanense TaxID=2842200 RepID=A0A926JPF6_9FLAO|nr:ecotin family protein [Sinomicrobium weinanense]MBC9795043.1 ecotin family protein [Sinomicrobium weinanense]MBU3123828.1 ecotin family protein [Sinomicrobium weinanense]